jgi:tetratricopeptide (TPR) repeat protein
MNAVLRSIFSIGARHLAFLLFMGLCVSAKADTGATFDAANKLYEQSKYAAAIDAYRKMIGEGPVSAPVYFNLGNAFYKSGRVGEAVASYRIAQQLAPRDPDIRGNLRFVREAAGTPEAKTPPWWQGWTQRLSLREWAFASALSVWLMAALGVLRQLRSAWRTALRLPLTLALWAVVFTGLGGGLAWHAQFGERIAVIKVKESVARFGPLDDSQTAFTLRDGTEISLVDRKDDWWQIEDGKGRRGWVKAATLLRLEDLKRS